MKKSFYWSVAFIAALVFAGVYSTNVFAEDILPPEEPEAPVVEETPAPVIEEETEPVVEPTEPTEPVEPTEPEAPVDTDGDTVADADDNCPVDANEDQADSDESGIGDACEEAVGEVQGLRISLPTVDICHAEDEQWDLINVTHLSILLGSDKHDDHGYDIIPPFEKIGPDYPGKNWDDAGQAIWNNGCEVPKNDEVTLHVQKIVCDAESDLPNWGAGGPDITSTTASEWLAENDESGCYLADWNFQWGYATQTSDPDDGLEDAGAGWNTFSDSALIDVANENDIRVRESADADYIGFTGQNTDQDVSAEVYCGTDVLHYDNWEWINDVVAGEDYYCVAWNVLVEEEACRVEVVSDETNIVEETLENAIATYNGHPSWTASIPGATWIWKTLHVENPLADETFTFKKTFIVEDVNDATLWVAADNSYEVRINGDLVNADTNENNFQLGTQENNINVLSFVDENTTNEITVKVKNWALTGGTWESNPAGALYRLVINAEEKDLCEQPEEETSEVTICKYENSLEGNLLSDWDVWLDHWAQDDFKATIVIDGHDYEGTTEENGCVTIADVPYGSYRLDEIMKDGWVNVSGAGSQVVVDSPEETFNLVNAHECNPELNLIENFGFETPIVVANGGAWEQFANGTPLLGWVADLVNTTTDAPLEIQSGYSGWVGHDGSEQYAELDSTAPTTISQDVPTTPGNKYRLTYWRAARPGTEPTNNANRALVDGVEVDSNVFASVGGNPDWYPSPVIEFTAANTLTNIAFKDDGSSADSYGTFIDDVALYCVPPVEEHHNRVTICKYEVNDEEDENNPGMPGWTVGLNKYQAPQPEVELVAINDEREYEGVTGQDGCVTFTDVDLAEYYVEEDMQDGWEYFSGAGGGTVWNIDSDQGTYTYNLINQRTGGGDDESCLVEGYKYDEEGNPLEGWYIGLEGYYYPEYTRQDIVIYEEQLIGSDVTDENGYYCIQGEVEGPGSNYSVYEVIQEGWDNVGAEINDDEVSEYYDNGDIASVEIGYLGDGMDVNFINQYEGPSDEQCSDEVDNDNDEAVDENDSDCQDDTPEVPGDDDDNGRRSGSNRNSFSGGGEVLGATTETNFCPFLRDYQHINMENDPSEVNKAKAFFNSYLGLSLPLDGTFDQSMFGAVVQFQNMFKPDVLDTWTEEFPGVLDDNATGYLYQTTKWKINSIICPGYETFPDQLIMAPGTTI
ncbi:MAG: hypothetical protein RLY47_45 [Candidatus Parcubacteria bacterium]